jgi:hypothetical protein
MTIRHELIDELLAGQDSISRPRPRPRHWRSWGGWTRPAQPDRPDVAGEL